MRVSLRHALPAVALLALAACKDDAPPAPAAITPVSDVGLSGTVDQLMPPLVVKVTDAKGAPVGGVPVTFAAAEGGGSVSPAIDTTDSDGEATTRWRLGTTLVAQRATATATGVNGSVSFVASVSAAAPATMTAQGGDNQSALAGAVVATAPSVKLVDRFQNPVGGVTVVFSVTSGGGTVTGAGATTNASGIATVGSWTLGPNVGINRLTAVALTNGATGNPIVFTANATAGTATTLTAQTATSLTATVAGLVTPVPTVRVTDANGNPVAGVGVSFTGSVGSNVVGQAKTTNSNGIAAPDAWQMGTVAQTYTLAATVAGASPVTFTAAANAGSAALVSAFAGNNQTAQVGRTLPTDPAVRVTDAYGNAVLGAEVVFTVTGGGGSAVARRALTDGNGVAAVGAWTLGDVPGVNSLSAVVTGANIGGNPVTFTAIATPGAPASMSVVSGNNQSGTAGAPLPVAPSVVVRDARGNPVPGVAVTFTANVGNGTVSVPNATTNASGVATSGTWTLGLASGTQVLTASSNNLPSITFVATAAAGAASRALAVTDSVLPNFPVNSFVSPLPQVRVVDANGNPVAGAEVTFVEDAGTTSTLTGAVKTTGADGLATLTSWRIGTAATTYRIRALITGVNQNGQEPTFVVTGTAANPVALQALSTQALTGQGNNQNTTQAPTVRVVDQFGNPVGGVAVTFTITSAPAATIGSPAQTTPLVITTASNGVASVGIWTIGAGAGQRDLTASISTVAGTVSLVFTATP